HATLCAHVASEGALLPACDAVIVTGAHRYGDVAQSPAGAGRVISLFRLREILALLGAPPAATQEDAPATAEPLVHIDDVWRTLASRDLSFDEAAPAAAHAAWFAPERELQKFLQKAGKQALKSSGN